MNVVEGWSLIAVGSINRGDGTVVDDSYRFTGLYLAEEKTQVTIEIGRGCSQCQPLYMC